MVHSTMMKTNAKSDITFLQTQNKILLEQNKKLFDQNKDLLEEIKALRVLTQKQQSQLEELLRILYGKKSEKTG